MSNKKSTGYNKHNPEFSQHYLDMFAVRTSRQYKDAWRKKMALLNEAINQFDFCSASLPYPSAWESLHELHVAAEKLTKRLSVEEWGR